MRTISILCVGCAMLSSAVLAGEPEVWLCPPGNRVLDLVKEEGTWDFSRRRIAGLKLYIGLFRKAKRADLAALAAFVRKNGLEVVVECGGTLNPDWQDETGERSAKVELAGFNKWYAAGGKVDYLDLDGPVRRLLGRAGWGKDPEKRFVSYERCARELMEYMAAVKKAHPKIQFFLLTNFPNWGYRGDVSYHARGPKRQDWGDYDEVVTAVLEAARKSQTKIAGATVDNPYEYLLGTHRSVKLKPPSAIDWLARVRAYEDFCRENGLEFNLIINSEAGGKASDRLFFEKTLDMVSRYRKAGGKPDRYFIQSWYKHPTKIVPESEPYSMTSLAKAILTQVGEGKPAAE